MNCPYCGKENENATFCTGCGMKLEIEPPVAEPVYAAPQPAAVVIPKPVQTIPPENRPLSPWAYFGLQLLFAVPVVGFVFLIVFSFSRGNINRRNFARSYWCALLIAVAAALVIAIIFVILFVTAGISLESVMDNLQIN